MSSSIFEVEIGSSADVGSSIKSTSGCTASALAIHSLCCCPPESPIADFFNLSLTSSNIAAPLRLSSTIWSNVFLSLMPCTLGPYAILSYMLIGNGFGCWKTMPTFLRSTVVSTDGAYIFSPSISMLPSILTLSTRSFILLIHFKNVDLPHPDGPISAVTLFSFMSILTPCSA